MLFVNSFEQQAAGLAREFSTLPRRQQAVILSGNPDAIEALRGQLSPEMYAAAMAFATAMKIIEEKIERTAGMTDEEWAYALGYIKGYVLYNLLEGMAGWPRRCFERLGSAATRGLTEDRWLWQSWFISSS